MSAGRPILPRLRWLYALHYGAAGLWIPYLAPFLESADVSGATLGVLFGMRNVAYVLTQPLLGLAADRFGIARVLRACALIAALTWPLVLGSRSPWALAGLFLLMAIGSSAIASLVDSAVLAALEGPDGGAAGGPRAFARSRVWGSVGFAMSALVFGLAIRGGEPEGPRKAMIVVAILQVGAALLALALPAASPARGATRPPALADAVAILRSPGIAWVLLAGALHWVTLAPYHTFFGAFVEHHGGGPRVVGLSIAVAVAVELVVMATAPRWLARFQPGRVLAFSTAAGALRWTLTATARGPAVIAAQALHGLGYGAFYLAMVDAVVRRTLPAHRATAQALIGSIAMGAGTLLGNVASGPLYDLDQGRTLFFAAAGFSVVSASVALAIPPAPAALPSA